VSQGLTKSLPCVTICDMETTTTAEAKMNGYDITTTDQAQREWDWESRKSAYSTVCDPDEDDYCESCDSTVTYSGPNDKYGTCKCDH